MKKIAFFIIQISIALIIVLGLMLPFSDIAKGQPANTATSPTVSTGSCEPLSIGRFQQILVEAPEFNTFAATSTRPGISAFICLIWIVIEKMLQLGIVVAVIMIVLSGYQYMLAAGEEKAISAAKSRLTYAIIGFVIVLLAIPIVNFAFGFLQKAGNGGVTGIYKNPIE